MSAIFSPCGLYRLRLDRVLDMLGGITVGFCLHNPSLAGIDMEDPTSTRGVGFALAWGASRLIYVNPWAGIVTKPRHLWRMADPVGPENDEHIAAAAREVQASGGFMVLAWGAVSPPSALRSAAFARLDHVEALTRSECADVRAIGQTKGGFPRHPLYAPADLLPLRWPDNWRTAA